MPLGPDVIAEVQLLNWTAQVFGMILPVVGLHEHHQAYLHNRHHWRRCGQSVRLSTDTGDYAKHPPRVAEGVSVGLLHGAGVHGLYILLGAHVRAMQTCSGVVGYQDQRPLHKAIHNGRLWDIHGG